MFFPSQALQACHAVVPLRANLHQTFYWTTIPKNRTSYHPSRGIKEDEISKIIQSDLIVAPNLIEAEKKLLAVDGLKRFQNQLKTQKEKDDFTAHMRRYMSIYLPDCPWEVNATNRYTIVTQEAAVTARRFIKRNETIKYLAGIQVVVTAEEEADMALRRKDFSLIISSRSKNTSLFMGPARFANHDCDANARLVTRSQAAIEIIACRDIEVGDEITVSYSESYFGEDNCDCLCHTCEQRAMNGWDQGDGASSVQKSAKESLLATDGYALRRRRRESTCDVSRASSVTPDIRPRVLKAKNQKGTNTRALMPGPTAPDSPPGMHSPLNDANKKRKREEFESKLATPPITPLEKRLNTGRFEVSPLPIGFARSCGSSDSDLGHSPLSSMMSTAEVAFTDISTPEAESPETRILSPKPIHLDQNISILKQEIEVDDVDMLQVPTVAIASDETEQISSNVRATIEIVPEIEQVRQTTAVAEAPCVDTSVTSIEVEVANLPRPQVLLGSELSTPSKSYDSAQESEPPTKEVSKPKRASKAVPKPARKQNVRRATPPAASQRQRVPGDYTLTPVLLAEPESAWVTCRNCSLSFVQHNAYYTKASCPRCERHSKLYGYEWPKTQPSGPRDNEERVLDHRLVHRFLAADDEARARGRQLSKAKEAAAKVNSLAAEPIANKLEEDQSAAMSGLRRSGRTRRPGIKAV
jgi:histone-lysine N-methyltransferase SUV420H